jgi:hypothetical protein
MSLPSPAPRSRPGCSLTASSRRRSYGYFMPSEGASDGALALFSFPSMAAYEQYRQRFDVDPAFNAADCIRDESGCVLRYERSFMRPFLGADK